jgi:hypothetical protein
MHFATILMSALLVLLQGDAGLRLIQIQEPRDVFGQVPKTQRESLRLAMEKLVAAEIRRDWKAVWDLYDKQSDETEASFREKMQQGRHLREFQTTKITFYPPDSFWIIEGCASFEGDTLHNGVWANVHAKWKDSRWLLSPIAVALVEGNEKVMKVRECSITK